MEQIKLFVDMSEVEQRVQLSGHLPSVESYQRRRMGTSAVGVCLVLHECVQMSSRRSHFVHSNDIDTRYKCVCPVRS